jgi:hypothetical protein
MLSGRDTFQENRLVSKTKNNGYVHMAKSIEHERKRTWDVEGYVVH